MGVAVGVGVGAGVGVGVCAGVGVGVCGGRRCALRSRLRLASERPLPLPPSSSPLRRPLTPGGEQNPPAQLPSPTALGKGRDKSSHPWGKGVGRGAGVEEVEQRRQGEKGCEGGVGGEG